MQHDESARVPLGLGLGRGGGRGPSRHRETKDCRKAFETLKARGVKFDTEVLE
jgi:hypothetical protein